MAVVGARPNLMKIAPLLEEMRKFPDMDAVLVHTGQHYDATMSDQFFQDLAIPAPDFNLGVGSHSLSRQTAEVMIALEPLMREVSPDLVMVVGDVNSTLAGALVAGQLKIPLAHVEAGLRSFDRDMPEELNRIVTDALAEFLFVTERSAVRNLQQEGIPEERIFFVGNVMVDTLLRHRDQVSSPELPARFGVTPGQYAVLTLHRPSNVDSEEVLSGLVRAIGELQDRVPVVFPVHPRTRARILELGLEERLDGFSHLEVLEPLGYLEFLGLMAQAGLVLTDSGGIQEETTALGIPCLTLRENTERPVTVSEGSNELVGNAPGHVVDRALSILESGGKPNRVPELWDGHAAERVIATIRASDDLPHQ